jgi:3-mercaptopyruvate sulfurtransferase SseA
MGVSEDFPTLVDGAWLAGVLGAADVRVLDYSFYLPTEQQDARAHFAAAHIPGAQFCDIESLADQETDLPHMVPTCRVRAWHFQRRPGGDLRPEGRFFGAARVVAVPAVRA